MDISFHEHVDFSQCAVKYYVVQPEFVFDNLGVLSMN
jgi:hypothetical protein